MNVLASVVLLAASFQLISSQGPPSDIPEECRRPPGAPGIGPFDCCKLPPFFEPKDLEECGFKKMGEGGPPHGPPGPGPRGPHPPHDCTKQLCVMEKYSLTKDGEVDQEALSAFLTEYGKKNENFAPAIEVAKEKCVGTGKELPGPPHICEADKMVFCVTTTLFSECPVWEDSDSCKTFKEHMDKCKPYFMKH